MRPGRTRDILEKQLPQFVGARKKTGADDGCLQQLFDRGNLLCRGAAWLRLKQGQTASTERPPRREANLKAISEGIDTCEKALNESSGRRGQVHMRSVEAVHAQRTHPDGSEIF